VNLKFKKISRR